MSQSLADTLPDGTDKAGLTLWLKSSGYARRLLLGPAGDPWQSAAQYLAFFTQAQGLLRPDVAVVEVAELYQSWVGRHPDLATEMAAKRRTSLPLRKLLEAEGPRKLLAEVLEAVDGSLRGRVPMVLALPAPRAFLRLANHWIGRGDAEVQPDDVEDAAMYMADLLRAVSTLPVGGVLLEDGPAEAATNAEDVAGYSALMNVARHYRWPLVLRLTGTPDAAALAAAAAGADAVIAGIGAESLAGKAVGVDAGAALWEQGALPAPDPWRFAFVEIPPEMKPEAVLDGLGRLRGKAHA